MATARILLAQVMSWHDGDTFHGLVDLGHHHVIGQLPGGVRCRIVGIDAPELTTAAGRAAHDYVMALVPPGLYPYESGGRNDDRGRPLLDLVLPDGTRLGPRMIADGHAGPWPPPVRS